MSKIKNVSQLRQVFYQSAPPASQIDEDVFKIFRGGYDLGVRDASAQAFNEAMAEQSAAALDADREGRGSFAVAFAVSVAINFACALAIGFVIHAGRAPL